jgi:hypothetical protein
VYNDRGFIGAVARINKQIFLPKNYCPQGSFGGNKGGLLPVAFE